MAEAKPESPYWLPEQELVWEERLKNLVSETAQAEDKARGLRAQARKAEEAVAVLKALKTSWDTHDPGKHGIASWLLTQDSKKCVAKEMLPPGTPVFTDEEKWKKFLETLAARGRKQYIWSRIENCHPYGAVPPWYPVVPLKETLHAPCPACSAQQPVIMTYEQTHDGPDGDTWTKERFVLCCQGLTPIGKPETCSSRF
jgi:hypothetical protein